jgi:hypothetical protein
MSTSKLSQKNYMQDKVNLTRKTIFQGTVICMQNKPEKLFAMISSVLELENSSSAL